MEDNNKVYGFTITMYEYFATIPTLWKTVKGTRYVYQFSLRAADLYPPEFIADNPQYLAEGNAMNYMSDDGGESYNLCHCKPHLPSVLDVLNVCASLEQL